MKIIGVDPGKDGAIVVLSEEGVVLQKTVMPVIGKILDQHELSRIFRAFDKNDCHVFIEDVHAIFGSAAGATFNFGFVCCAPRQACCDFNLRFTLVQPKAWQKVIYQGIPEHRKASITIKKGKRAGQTMKGKLDTKKMSEIAAKRLFPEVDLRKNERCSVSHIGVVDALLIAEYGKRTL